MFTSTNTPTAHLTSTRPLGLRHAPVALERSADRPAAEPRLEPHAFALMLDEVDFGMLAVTAAGRVVHLNHAARRDLDSQHPLQLREAHLHTADLKDQLALQDGLMQARRGLRKMVALGSGAQRSCVTFVPLSQGPMSEAPLVMVTLQRRQVCEQLSLMAFAKAQGLTSAEARVLGALCEGMRPTEIAKRDNVAVSTIRTQIGSIRTKTGAGSIRDLVQQVAVLPPLLGSLRQSSATLRA